MKKILFNFNRINGSRLILFLFIVGFISACASHIEKRRYRKGYYFSKSVSSELHHQNVKKAYVVNRNFNANIGSQPLVQETEITEPINPVNSKPLLDRTPKVIHKNELCLRTKAADDEVSSVIRSQRQQLQMRDDQQVSKGLANGLIYFTSLLLIPFISRSKKVKHYSAWAARHVVASRSLLAVSSLAGLVSVFELGNLYKPYIAPWMMVVPLGVTAGAFLINENYLSAYKINNRKQVSYGLFHIANLFGAFGLGANTQFQLINSDPFVTHPVVIALLTILLIAVFAASVAGIAVLSCNIACGGAETLALFVFFGLNFLVSYLISLGMFNLYKRESNQNENMMIKSLIAAAIITGIIAVVLIVLAFG